MIKRCLFLALLSASLTGYGQSLFAAKETGKKWGYVDTVGTYVIQPVFETANAFNGEYAVVKSGKKWGVIKKSGEFVIAPTYDDAQAIVNEGKATVKLGKFWGVVDLKGATVLPFQHEYLSVYNEGFIVTGRKIKTPGACYNMDVSILNDKGQLVLDFDSYKLPGKIIDSKNWELGNYPMVHDGWILLYYDHAFDLDPFKKLNPLFNYILAHHVRSGMPNSEPIVTLGKSQKLTYLPEYREGLLATTYDPLSANYYDLWNPTTLYYGSAVISYDGKWYEYNDSLGASKNKAPATSPQYWKAREPLEATPSASIYTAIQFSRFLVDNLGANSQGPWKPTESYYSGDMVFLDGRLYVAAEDNRNHSPTERGYIWEYRGPVVDTTGARYFLSVQRSGVRAENLYPTFEGKILAVLNNRLFLSDAQGWTFPTKVSLNNMTLAKGKPVLAGGLLQLVDKTSGKHGYVDSHGTTKIPFTLEESFPFFDRFTVAKLDGKYGLIRKDGGWVLKPRFEQLVSEINLKTY